MIFVEVVRTSGLQATLYDVQNLCAQSERNMFIELIDFVTIPKDAETTKRLQELFKTNTAKWRAKVHLSQSVEKELLGSLEVANTRTRI